MKKTAEPCDVFLSASLLDAGVAEVVRQSFEARGLKVFKDFRSQNGVESLFQKAPSCPKMSPFSGCWRWNWGQAPAEDVRSQSPFPHAGTSGTDSEFMDAIRSAIAESRVFVAIVSRASMNNAKIAVEIGAAWGWGKSIHFLLSGLSSSDLPGWLARHPHAPITELAAVIDEIVRAIVPLTPEQAEALAEAYNAIGVPTDQLSNRLGSLDELTDRFNRKTMSSYPQERVLQELIRLRKRGRLPRLKRKTG